jgi:transaldolase
VTELAAPETVNTMPEKTLEATFDHAPVHGDAVIGTFDDARATIAAIEAMGISLNDVTELLEREGVDKFIVSWNELLDIVTAALDSAR